MSPLPPWATANHLDQDSDDMFQARQELYLTADKLNLVIIYLTELFGTDGTKATANATLGGGVPVGTRQIFVQNFVPIGWVRVPYAGHHYFFTTDGNDGGTPWGGQAHVIATSAVVLGRGHLPSGEYQGITTFNGDHSHNLAIRVDATFTGVAGGPTSVVRGMQTNTVPTSGGGTHQHNFGLNLGGANVPHDHVVNLTDFRPKSMASIVGQKS